MKASIYFNYASRSLFRGGQRTILAIFCVAVGVMALVALQLVGQLINSAFTSNVRAANGGDIAVSSQTAPFRESDLVFFDQLKSEQTITAYTPIITANGSLGATSILQSFSLKVVDPDTFPVVAQPSFKTPTAGTLTTLLTNNQVIVDQALLDQYQKKVGDTFAIRVGTGDGGSLTVPITIAGIVNDAGVFAQANDFMLLSLKDYRAAAHSPLLYTAVDVATSDQKHTEQAAKAITQRFQVASVVTADQALKNSQAQVEIIQKFLAVAGLLALLIGGVGIVNTMQVLLSRRRIEIATLKTTGYRRSDLYLLFGLEAALLGLIGGVIGAAASIGVSYLVRVVVQQLFPIVLPFFLDPLIIGGGVAVGLMTALIFGLLPIVQAANIRPLSVIRELPEERRAGNILLTLGLLLLLSVLFCLMAIVILHDVIWAVATVYGGFILLALLSLLFSLVVLAISALPVPERFTARSLIATVAGVAVSALLYLISPPFSILLLIVTLSGFLLVLGPRIWKSNTRIALRNIGRQRARTTTTLLALFVGVFTIGLILVLGQDLRDQVNGAISRDLSFNVAVITPANDADTLQPQLVGLPNLSSIRRLTYAAATPAMIDGVSFASLTQNSPGGPNDLGRDLTAYYLGGIEGYDVAHQQLPDTQGVTITGRNLNAGDAGTNNVLLNAMLINNAPLKGHLHLNSTIELTSKDGSITKTVTVVGFYQPAGFNIHFGPVLATTTTVAALSTGPGKAIFYLKVPTEHVGKTLQTLGSIAPNALVYNFANLGDFINGFIGDVLLVLTTIASLSLLAGILIIANAVALAMLERRRELGIFKAVGYTSRTLLAEVLIENGMIGGTGALLAMLLVTLATGLLGKFFFKSDFGVNWLLALGLIAGIALLSMLISALVAWGTTRVRPLEVLRYE